jgi:anti-sigma factor RsiW
MDDSSRDPRLSSTTRGLYITGLILAYTWFSKDPGVSLKVTFLIAAGLQLAVVVARRFVPADELPGAIYIFEMIADGVTVLMFAIGVFGALGSIARLEI